MKNVVRIAAILFLSFAGLSSTRVSAIIFYCSDVCASNQACTRGCTDDTGSHSNCGSFGCCFGHVDNC